MFNVFIYCDGDSTLNNTFNNNGFNSIYIKSFTNEEQYNIIEKSSSLYDQIYIIDSYRTPIEHKIYSFFQNIKNDLSMENIIDTFNKDYLYIEEFQSINEVLDYYKLPQFDKFDFEKKYNIIKHGNITFIKLLFNDISNWDVILSEIFQKQITIYKDNLTENRAIYNLFKEQYKLPIEFIYTNLIYDKEFSIYNTLEEQEQYISCWLSNSIHSTKINKTMFGKNKTLYLKSEVDQHYVDIYSDEIININNSIIIDYYNILQSFCQNSHIFIVPDKSIINQQDLPENIDSKKLFRFADNINHPKIHNLYKCTELTKSHYYKTDSHINHQGSLLIFYKIMEILGFEKPDIKYNIHIHNNYKGDLTEFDNIGIEENKTSFIKEDVVFHNVINDSKNVITKLNPYNRICFSRQSKYFINENYIINKKILIFGDSTTSDQLLFDYFTSIFKETLFYWSHFYINNDLIKEYNPDIILDIRTERFLQLYSSKLQLKICNPMKNLTLSLNTNQIIERIILSKNLNEILNIYTLDEINDINNNILFSNLLYYNNLNIKNIKNISEDFNWKDYVELNEDLKHMNKQEATTHYELYGYNEKRKYKYENIPEDFNWKDYVELNEDLNHMNKQEATTHYELYGIKKRKYKYENISEDFNWKDYVELNEDLKHMNKQEATTHYELYGYNEKRKYKYENIPEDFNWKDYVELNGDLKHMNKQDATTHYKLYGIKEGRKYKYENIPSLFLQNTNNDFNWKDYVELNEDLNHMNKQEATTHYELYGIKKRKYKYENISEDFNWKDYVELNEDLKHMNKQEATTHYELYGIKERRKYSKFKHYKQFEYDKYISLNTENIIYTNKHNISNYSNFILIIDYNYTSGGTTFFMNSILEKYSKTQNILVAKNIDGYVHFFINTDIKVIPKYDNYSAYLFLKKIKNKIIKIFINHTLRHHTNFIQNVLSLNDNISLITHDYNSIMNEPQPTFDKILEKNKNNIFDINKCKMIISQNNVTMNYFTPYINNNMTQIVCPLPDYRDGDLLINTQNEKTIIGIIGNISDIKGLYIIKMLLEKYTNDDRFDFVVFGKINILGFTQFYPYKNINELNKLLIQHKPNILLETSMWPETYSYTLTLSKITQLPILYYNKNFPSVIKDRLKDYKKSYVFNNIFEFEEQIIQYKQDYFYTISDKIYYPSFWDEYFDLSITNTIQPTKIKKSFSNKNVVLITSKIIVDNSLSYTYSYKRSVYTSEERFQQTEKTISSIRLYIPNSHIILFDNSKFSDIEHNKLNILVDDFINITDDPVLDYYTDKTTNKLLGELVQMIYVYKSVLINYNFYSMNLFFKISGRYFINENFNYTNYNNKDSIFKLSNFKKDYYFTSFYKLDKNILQYFFEKIIQLFNNLHLYLKYDYEIIIPSLIKDKKIITNLGITQIFGSFNIINNI